MTDLYQEIILEEARNPQNFGNLDDADFTQAEKNASCGDNIVVFLNLSPDKKTIKEIRWQGDGCTISKASMSVLSDMLINIKVSEVKNLKKEDIMKQLGLKEISPGRLKCLMLGLKAVEKLLSMKAN